MTHKTNSQKNSFNKTTNEEKRTYLLDSASKKENTQLSDWHSNMYYLLNGSVEEDERLNQSRTKPRIVNLRSSLIRFYDSLTFYFWHCLEDFFFFFKKNKNKDMEDLIE